MKHCNRCGKDKPISDFAKDASKACGVKSLCKSCDNEKSRRYYVERIGGYRKRSHDQVAADREYRTALRRDPCAYCGEPMGGVIDHIEPKVSGGSDGWANLTGACESCNCSKNALPLLYFLGRKRVDAELLPLLEQRAGWIGADVRGNHFRDVSRWAERRGAFF